MPELESALKNQLLKTLPAAPLNSNIGILGGSFNPPHLCHLLMGVSALYLEELDNLWIMPCADHPMGKKLASFEDRVSMCKVAFGDFSNKISVCTLESALSGPSYTVQTLEQIKSLRPDLNLKFIIGSDLVEQIENWKNPKRIQELAQIIIFPRKRFDIKNIPTILKSAKTHHNIELPDITSTIIRELTNNKLNNKNNNKIIEGLTKQVAQIIKDRNLYS